MTEKLAQLTYLQYSPRVESQIYCTTVFSFSQLKRILEDDKNHLASVQLSFPFLNLLFYCFTQANDGLFSKEVISLALCLLLFFWVGFRIFIVNSRRVFTTQMTCEVLTTLNKGYKSFYKLFDSLLAFVLAIKPQKKLTSTSGCCQEPQSLIWLRLRSIPIRGLPFTHKKSDFGVISVQLSVSPRKVFRELEQQRQQRLQKHHLRSEFALFQTRSRFSFNLTNVSEFFCRWVPKDCMEAQGKKTIAILLSSCPPQNVKLGGFTSYSCSDDKEMYKRRWSTRKVVVLLIQTCCYFVCCPHRRRCLSSLRIGWASQASFFGSVNSKRAILFSGHLSSFSLETCKFPTVVPADFYKNPTPEPKKFCIIATPQGQSKAWEKLNISNPCSFWNIYGVQPMFQV